MTTTDPTPLPPTPRIEPLAEPTGEAAELLAAGLKIGERPVNILATLAKHPKLLKRFNLLGGFLLNKGMLPAREREIVILRVGWKSRSVYEFGQHTIIGRAAGLTDDEIARVARPGTEGWGDDDRLLVAMADELCDANVVGDATWSGLAARWSEPELLELVVVAGFYRLVSGFLNTVGVRLDDGVPGWPDGATPAG